MKLTEKQTICKTIFDTQEYYTKKPNRKEPILFIRYLQELNYNLEDAFEIWFPIEYKSYGGERETKLEVFKRLWAKAKTIIWGDDPYIGIIYKDELDNINNTDMPRWAKELMVCLVLFSRIRRSFKYDVIMFNKFIKYTSYPKGHRTSEDTARIAPLLNKYGFITIKEYVYTDKYTGEQDKDIVSCVTVKHSKSCNEVVFGIDKLSDMKQIKGNKDIVSTFKKCEICGKEFEYTLLTQKNICDDCWKEQEKIRLSNKEDDRERHDSADERNTHNKYIKQQMMITKICTCCGKSFNTTSKCKRCLCDECYKKQRKNIINQSRMRNYYNM